MKPAKRGAACRVEVREPLSPKTSAGQRGERRRPRRRAFVARGIRGARRGVRFARRGHPWHGAKHEEWRGAKHEEWHEAKHGWHEAKPERRGVKPERAEPCVRVAWRGVCDVRRSPLVHTRVSPERRLYFACLVPAGFTGAVRTRFESESDSISHPASRRDDFFTASRTTVPRLLMRCLKPLTAAWGAHFVCCDTRRPSAVARESSGNSSGRRATRVRAARFMRTRPCCQSHAGAPPLSQRHARTDGSTEFQVNSSNRFFARAEVAHANAGHVLPWQRAAHFHPAAAEQSFGLSIHPAVGLEIPAYLISSSTRARRPGGVAASVARC